MNPGATRRQGWAVSSCRATASKVASLPGGPTSWTANGIPEGPVPVGTDIAGQPATFHGAAKGA